MSEVTVAKFTIDNKEAQLAVERMDRVLQLMGKSLKDAKAELSGLFVDTTGKIGAQDKAMGSLNKQREEGVKGIREFRAEQRIQDFVVREGTQALTGMVFALAFLTQGQEGAGGMSKKLSQSLLAGAASANAAEFSLFALGRVANSLPGPLGLIATRIAGLSGPIALAIGFGTSLITFFSQANEEAKKASEEGIKKFTEGFQKLSRSGQIGTVAALKQQIDALKTQRDALSGPPGKTAAQPLGQGLAETVARFLTDQEKERRATLDSELEAKKNLLKAAEEELKVQQELLRDLRFADDALKGQYTTTVQLSRGIVVRKQELENGVDALTQQALTNEEIRKRLDEINKLEFDRSQILKSSKDIAKDKADMAKIELQLHRGTVESYIDSLRALRNVTLEEKERLGIDLQIQQIIDEMTNKEIARQKTREDAAKRAANADEELFKTSETLELEVIQNVFQRRSAEEEKKHTQAMADIEERAARAGEIEVDEEGRRKFVGEAARAQALEEQRHAQETGKIKRDGENEIVQLKIEGIIEEEARIRAKFAFETQLVEQSADSRELKAEKIHNLEIRMEREVNDLRMRNIEDLVNGAQNLANALERAFSSGGDTFISKLFQALQLAIQIYQQVEKINALRGAGQDATGSTLSLIGSIIGLFAGFQHGGYTGAGPANRPAGIVHAGEIVFEKPLADRFGAELLALRESMKNGGRVERVAGQFVQSAPPIVNIRIYNPVTLEQGLRVEMSNYEKFRSKKIVD